MRRFRGGSWSTRCAGRSSTETVDLASLPPPGMEIEIEQNGVNRHFRVSVTPLRVRAIFELGRIFVFRETDSGPPGATDAGGVAPDGDRSQSRQERVSGGDEPRAADAAERGDRQLEPADGHAAGRGPAGVRGDDPEFQPESAAGDQRHSRFEQDRSRPDDAGAHRFRFAVGDRGLCRGGAAGGAAQRSGRDSRISRRSAAGCSRAIRRGFARF